MRMSVIVVIIIIVVLVVVLVIEIVLDFLDWKSVQEGSRRYEWLW